jgi:hypothetical protein
MKALQFCTLFFVVVSCTAPPKQESISTYDSTKIADSAVSITRVANESEEPTAVLSQSIVEKDGELLLEIPNQYSFISDPYDFPLDPQSIADLLGEGAEIKEEKTEAGEDEEGGTYEAYSYYTIEGLTDKISFYSYPGKHFATIKSALLPLKNSIKVGISKQDFLDNMNIRGDSLMTVTLFRLSDDYGSIDFIFRADTLNTIAAYYEEGD